MKGCIYPGTFDPVTNGHIDVIMRASKIFDKIIVGVAENTSKKPTFGLQKRIEMVRIATKNIENVEVESFDTLLVDYAKKHSINVVIRGLRAVSDFEYELQMGYANASLWNKFETIYLMPSLENAFISSSIVRAILSHDGDVSKLVPKVILEMLKK